MGIKLNYMNKIKLDSADIFFALWCAAMLIFLLSRPQPKPKAFQAPEQKPVSISRHQEVDRGEAEMLARLIESEANNQSDQGKIAVANVVMNAAYLNGTSIITEIFTEGRYHGVNTKTFRRVPSEESRKAATLALSGYAVIPEDFIYYLNPQTATDKRMKAMSKANESRVFDDHIFFSPFPEKKL